MYTQSLSSWIRWLGTRSLSWLKKVHIQFHWRILFNFVLYSRKLATSPLSLWPKLTCLCCWFCPHMYTYNSPPHLHHLMPGAAAEHVFKFLLYEPNSFHRTAYVQQHEASPLVVVVGWFRYILCCAFPHHHHDLSTTRLTPLSLYIVCTSTDSYVTHKWCAWKQLDNRLTWRRAWWKPVM